MRLSLVVSIVVSVALAASGCSAVDVARELGRGGAVGATSAPCPSAPPAPATTPSATPTVASPTLSPAVASQLRDAIAAVRGIDGVERARVATTYRPNQVIDPTCTTRDLDEGSFAAVFTVLMRADASPDAAGQVPTTMAERLAWTGVTLDLTVPAATGRVATTVHYDGTFDQTIPIETSRSVADALARIAATRHVSAVQASIPYTMRVDFGSLTVHADTRKRAALAAIRGVIDRTVFRDTSLHGAFVDGAKP